MKMHEIISEDIKRVVHQSTLRNREQVEHLLDKYTVLEDPANGAWHAIRGLPPQLTDKQIMRLYKASLSPDLFKMLTTTHADHPLMTPISRKWALAVWKERDSNVIFLSTWDWLYFIETLIEQNEGDFDD